MKDYGVGVRCAVDRAGDVHIIGGENLQDSYFILKVKARYVVMLECYGAVRLMLLLLWDGICEI